MARIQSRRAFVRDTAAWLAVAQATRWVDLSAADAPSTIATTSSGRVRGAVNDGITSSRASPTVGPPAGRTGSCRRQAGAVDRRARRARLRADRAAGIDPAASRRSGGRRRLPGAERLHAGARHRPAPGDGVAARRRLLHRLGLDRDPRRQQSRAHRRRRRGHHQPPAERVRLHLPRRGGRRRLRALGRRRHARHRRGARVGARQHRPVRRRSEPRHHLRAVGRRPEGGDADGDAHGEGAVPSRDHRERRRAAPDRRKPTRCRSPTC